MIALNSQFDELVQKTTAELERLQYSQSSISKYQACWEKFRKYADNHDICEFSDETAEQYFQDTFGLSFIHPKSPLPTPARRDHRFLSVLSQVKSSGIFYNRRPTKDHSIEDCYQPAASKFLSEGCTDFATSTQRQMRTHLEEFLRFLSIKKITDFNAIRKNDILAFWDTRSNLKKNTRLYDSFFLHKFFDFLYEHGYTMVDNSVFVPKIKGPNQGQIPSYYTTDELTTLISCVDRNNPMGKRDYAILLFAIRYAPRVEDIRNLKLGDIDWDKSIITYVQRKTQKRIILNLYDDVATALIDYFENGRPETKCRHVFVRHNAPFMEFGKDDNLHYIISKYMRFAGFTDFHRRKHGLHSMRHSIAGNMLNEGVPMPLVSEVLNHSSTDTTMHYTKIAVEQLRTCALEVN